MIMLTTTAVELDEELVNRALVLTVDEDREQTRAIHQRQRARRTLDGLLATAARTEVLALHRNAQRLLEPVHVVNPYAPQLTFLDARTRTRRDHEKYLTLIDTVAFLHQHQRARKSVTHQGQALGYIEATLDDIAVANRLADAVLGRSLDELPPQARKLLALLTRMVEARAAEERVEAREIHFSRRAVREYTGWSDFQVRVHLAKLEALEYVVAHRGARGQLYVYELLYRGEGETEGHERPRFLMGLLDVERLREWRDQHGYDRNIEGSRSDIEPSAQENEHRPSPDRAPDVSTSSGAGAVRQSRAAVHDLADAPAMAAKITSSASRNGTHPPRRTVCSSRKHRCGRAHATSTTTSIAAAIAAHLAALTAANYAASTVAARRAHLALFREWCDVRGVTTLEALTPAVLERYQHWLACRRTADGVALSWSTQSNMLTAVRMLLAWATRTKRLTVNPAADFPMARRPNRLPRAVLSVSEAERVLAEPDLRTALGLRDRAILEVLYSTGIRRMELVGLDLSDLDAERGVLFVREGKGKKDRLVPIGERAIRWTHRYLDQVRERLAMRSAGGRGPPRSPALFLSARGTRIRPSRLTERLHRYLVASGVAKPGSCHVWRHTAATLMHDGGADIRDLQEMLGHAQLTTTQLYTRVSIERLKAVHTRTHPARLTHLTRVRVPASSSLAASSTAEGAASEEAAEE